PLNPEACDAEGHDEDCDPGTYGRRDLDRDGEDDFRCFNRAADGSIYRGTDLNDNDDAVRQGAMICDGPDAVVVISNRRPLAISATWEPEILPCPTGTKCVVQPNRQGICIVPPIGYVAPGRFAMPGPLPLPSLRQLLSERNALKRPGPKVPKISTPPSVPREQPGAAKPKATPTPMCKWRTDLTVRKVVAGDGRTLFGWPREHRSSR
ncbi:MAG TPA: hypothetical protein VMS31_15405, partial [Pyrinomonadaceae bacterium]|nr:hypothetical protein [Pyrinomonadaceae bacterium]